MSNPVFERFNLPVIGPFLMSWPIYNWRFSIYLLGNNSADQKVAYFLAHKSFGKTVGYPFLSGIFFSFLMPYFIEFYAYFKDKIDQRSHKRDVMNKNIKETLTKILNITKKDIFFLKVDIDKKHYRAIDNVYKKLELFSNNDIRKVTLNDIKRELKEKLDQYKSDIDQSFKIKDLVNDNRNPLETWQIESELVNLIEKLKEQNKKHRNGESE